MENPFKLIETKLNNIESLLLEIKQKPKQAKEKLHSLHSLANYVGVHYQTVRNWVAGGKVKCKEIGGRKFIEQSEFDKALSNVKSLKYKR